MGRVKSFDRKAQDRIGNYRVLQNIGRGWEGEVYKVEEVPTEALRALKLFSTDSLDKIRDVIHYAWYFEQVRPSGCFPVYYHYGQWFFDDDSGCWFLVFEFVPGKTMRDSKASEELYLRMAQGMARVHGLGYAIGDIETLENVIVRESDGEPIFVDCNAGKADHPNQDFRQDCTQELGAAARKMFGKDVPPRVAALLKRLRAAERFSRKTLANALAELGEPRR